MKPLVVLLLLATSLSAAPPPQRPENVSLRHEVEMAIGLGLGWLAARQQPGGAWGDPRRPGLTALALLAFFRAPDETYPPQQRPEYIERALAFLRGQAKPDGGIHAGCDAVRHTAHCLQALLHARDPADEALVERAAAFLAKCQIVSPADSLRNGGFALNAHNADSEPAPSVATTYAALESLRTFQQVHPDAAGTSASYDRAAAISFLARHQLLAATDSPAKRGAFAESTPASQQATACGAITCAGLLGLLYAGAPASDPRVSAALGWLGQHYTVDENPGCGWRDYHEYLHLLAKALSALAIEELERPTGARVYWPRDLALKLVNSQTSAGTWQNPDAPDDPTAATIEALLTLEIVHAQL